VDRRLVSGEEIYQESLWLQELGLIGPAGGHVLPEPFRAPLTPRSFVTPASWYRYAPDGPIDAASLTADLPILALAMEKAYIGWELLETRGWQWADFFRQWQVALENRGLIAPAEAFAPWLKLRELQCDNHSGPLLPSFQWQRFSRLALMDRIDEPVTGLRNQSGEVFSVPAGDAARQPWRVWQAAEDLSSLHEVFALAYPSHLGVIEAVYAGGTGHRLENLPPLSDQPVDEPCYVELDKGIGYLRIPTLSLETSERIANYQDWLPQQPDHGRALIVDLRGNQGGAVMSAISLLEHLLGRAALSSGMEFTYRAKHSCVTDALFWGFAQAKMANIHPPLSESLRIRLQELLDRLGTDGDPGCPVNFQSGSGAWNYGLHQRPAKADVFVLVDGNCGSDGEFLAYLLASRPGSVVIGTNTAGVAQFIRPGCFVLPHTRIVFRLATGVSDIYGDGRSFDGYGLRPDVLLPPGAMAGPEALLSLVELLAG
jgi:hypothetical protein